MYRTVFIGRMDLAAINHTPPPLTTCVFHAQSICQPRRVYTILRVYYYFYTCTVNVKKEERETTTFVAVPLFRMYYLQILH